MMKKTILFKLELEGRGIVNMDSNDQKYLASKTHLKSGSGHNNVSYAKKDFYEDEDGKLKYRIKISRDTLMHDMYKNEIISQNPSILHHDALLYSYIGSPVSIVRGYMFANSNKNKSIKRKGAITFCDAEQTCNAVSNIETFSRSGDKVENDGTTDKKDNTFYHKETVGNIKYDAIGSIDLMALQFLTCDHVFDRYSFNPDHFDLYKEFLSKKLPNFNSKLGYYQLNDSSIDMPEYGVLLSNENILFLVKETLKKLIELNVRRKGAFAKTASLKIKLVENPIEDKVGDENGWITISDYSDIESLDFESTIFYSEVDLEVAKKQREVIEENKKKALAFEKEKNEKKSSNKKARENE